MPRSKLYLGSYYFLNWMKKCHKNDHGVWKLGSWYFDPPAESNAVLISTKKQKKQPECNPQRLQGLQQLEGLQGLPCYVPN